MILISHRGNLDGKNEHLENSIDYVQKTINLGYDVEIDIWLIGNKLWLGHDNPQYSINIEWLKLRKFKLWIHCKNIDSLLFLKETDDGFNYFWHENDTLTLTSLGYIWAYPGKQPIKNSIAVLPEIYSDKIQNCLGICSDYILKYKKYE